MDNPAQTKRKPQSQEEMDRFLSEEERKRMPFTRKDFEDALKRTSRRIEKPKPSPTPSKT